MEFGTGRRGPGAVRGAAARRHARRQHALQAPGRRRGGVADHGAAGGRAAAGPSLRQGLVGPGRRRTACSPATAAGASRGSADERLRRHRHRQRRGRRHARPPPRPVRQAHPAARARRLAAARAAELAGPRRVRRQPLRLAGHLVRRARQAVPAAGPLLRRRRDEALRRRAVPAARGGLRRAAPPRRDLARVADRLRRDGAVLHAGRAALRGPRRARRGPDRAARPRRRTRSPRSATSRGSSSSPTTSRPPGYHPFHAPVRRPAERGGHAAQPLRALRDCDGFPCLVHAKSDAEVLGVRPALEHPNVTLLTERRGRAARDERAGTAVTGVVVDHGGERETYSADLVVVSCGAANSARLLLASATDAHPDGLANGSDQVGRNYMFHNSQAVLALSKEPNPTVFQKTLGLNDFYFGGARHRLPAGQHPDGRQVRRRRCTAARSRCRRGSRRSGRSRRSPATPSTSGSRPRTCRGPRTASRCATDGSVRLELHAEQRAAQAAAAARAQVDARRSCGMHHDHLIPRHAYLKNEIPVAGCAHQAGTCRFGDDPADVGARHATAARTRSTTCTSSTRASSRASAR